MNRGVLRGCALAGLLGGCLDSFPAPPADGDAEPGDALADARLGDARPGDARPGDARPGDARPEDVGPGDAGRLDDAVAGDGATEAGVDATVDPDGGCLPNPEACNGLDDDCNGQVDDVLGRGDPCSAGLGTCRRAGALACDLEAGELACDAQPADPIEEICNTLDDDCDGEADEDLGVGAACTVGEGVCAAVGIAVCDDLGGVLCVGEPGLPGVETCDGQDEDCDGLIDEGFMGVGMPCEAGVGVCRQAGQMVCTPEGTLACGAVAGQPADERCNTLDDDCDGQADEGLGLEAPCTVGLGLCQRPGQSVCGEDGHVTCAGDAGFPVDEVCDGRDQDCDGEIDNGFGLGEACFVGVGACLRVGAVTCQGCSVNAGGPAPEACNDLDDDCDGRVDEGNTCVATAVQACRLWIGQADVNAVPAEPSPSWDGCPISDQDREGDVRCTSSGRDGYFYALPLTGNVDDNDVLSVALTCDAGPVPEWVQRHCVVYLAHGDTTGTGSITALDPATCTDRVGPGPGPNPRCVHTGGDGLFHPMWLQGDVNSDDVFGITLRCTDAERPDRAAGLQDGLAATFAWHFRDRGVVVLECSAAAPAYMNDVPEWTGCPRDGTDLTGTRRCATGTREGAFRAFEIGDGHDVAVCSAFGVALRSR